MRPLLVLAFLVAGCSAAKPLVDEAAKLCKVEDPSHAWLCDAADSVLDGLLHDLAPGPAVQGEMSREQKITRCEQLLPKRSGQ